MKYIEPVGVIGPANAYGHDYVDKNAGAGQAGSFVAADAIEHPMLELVAMITKSGLTPTDGDLQQLARSVRSQSLNFVGVVGGTANALTATLDPAPASQAELNGSVLRLVVNTPNTAAATLAVNGFDFNIVRQDTGGALTGGELLGVVEVLLKGTQALLMTGKASFRGIATYVSSGSFTVPAGVFSIFGICTGAGGGGGGGGGGGSNSSAAGGGAGGTALGWKSVTPGQVIPITVSGSTGGGGNPGGNGASSSIGSLMSATGGDGGSGQGASTMAGGFGGLGSGGTINIAGGDGGDGYLGASLIATGQGGASFWGGGGRAGSGGGRAGIAPGSGGGGSYGPTAGFGGNGGGGLVVILW